MGLDGYVITATAQEALEAFGEPGVRHVAELDTGEGFVAFDGEQPVEGELLIARLEEFAWWWKVRRIAPTSPDEQEHLALVTPEQMRELLSPHVLAASKLTSGLILIQTTSLIVGAEWSASSIRILDTRLEAELAKA